jgi:hypothetical protein
MFRRAATVPILTWHAVDVAGPDYASNDHVAFRDDLEHLHRLGLRVVPLAVIAKALVRGELASLSGCVGLSFDDGADFDFHDLPHPAWGVQRSMSNILGDFAASHGNAAQPSLHATSFAVVSPEARKTLDATCMIGCGWWNDDWYRQAEQRGTLSIESHSWDHNHPSLAATVTNAPRGGFMIADEDGAQAEIAQSAPLLRSRRARGGDVLFAYPYGDVSPFVAEEWFPRHGEALGMPAAFSADDADPVHRGSSRWAIPRFTARHQWKSPAELERLLGEARALPRQGLLSSLFAAKPAKVEPTIHGAAAELPSWRECLRTWEVNDARVVAGDLFKRSLGHDVPDMPHHYVLVYSPPAGSANTEPQVVAYVHQLPKEGFHLCGGMCVDMRAYRNFPRWLFDQVRDAGGLATIVTSDSMQMLGDSPASFGVVGDAKARAADLRTGFVDTGVELLMVKWLKPLPDAEKERLIARAATMMPF